jgi:hypothetical protein
MLSTLRMPLRQLLGVLWRPAGAALIMYLLLEEGRQAVVFLWSDMPDLVLLLASVLAGASIYALTVVIFWWASGRPISTAEGVLLSRVSRAAGQMQGS